MESIQNFDFNTLIYLNNLGNSTFDSFWMFITSQTNWTPLFLFILYLVFKKFGFTKQLLAVIFSVALTVVVTNETTDLYKESIKRLRPNNDPQIENQIRSLKNPQSYSFISGHASNSMAVTTFVCLLLFATHKNILFMYAWPLLFGYSRIYVGVHYPTDIIAGYIWGALMGFLLFKTYQYADSRLLKNS